MDNPSQTALIKASIILPMEGLPIKRGAVLLKDGRIQACLDESELPQVKETGEMIVYDFPDAIVSPGLINLHTHLEYSLLKAHNASLAFIPWIKSLQEATRAWDEETWRFSAYLGVTAALKAGTTCLVENSYAGFSAEAIAKAGLKAVIGLEVFGVNQETAGEQWARWLEKLAKVKANASETLSRDLSEKKIRLTVAAHAPYTVCPALWLMAKEWAADNDEIVLAHAAESENECRWFASQDPELDALLAYSFGKVPTYKGDPVLASKAWRKSGQTPVQHLENYHLLDEKLLVAHAVQISEADAKILAKRGVKIAHCPRSNSRLRNGLAPIDLFSEHDLTFGLGTDSLASCDDLDPLSEARFAIGVQRALNRQSTFAARQALEAVTIKAAKAIGMDSQIGSLLPGKKADLAVFKISEDKRTSDLATNLDPYELLVHGQCKLTALFIDGREVVGVPVNSVPPRSAPAKV
jgi:cytosine/adenosine deaminase-related metal-dependent hydrolase